MQQTPDDDKTIIGRTEVVDFPQLGLAGISARVDTGALTSCIHCADVQIVEIGGNEVVAFTLLDPDHGEYTGRILYADEFATKVIRSSNGQEEERFVITSDIVVAGHTLHTEFTLADREHMSYPVLLGRRLLRGRFLVDVAIAGTTEADEAPFT